MVIAVPAYLTKRKQRCLPIHKRQLPRSINMDLMVLEHRGVRPHTFKIGFSLGVFQWVPKSGGKGLKKSAVKVRVKGFVRNTANVYDKAREICLKLDAGETISQKSISV